MKNLYNYKYSLITEEKTQKEKRREIRIKEIENLKKIERKNTEFRFLLYQIVENIENINYDEEKFIKINICKLDYEGYYNN